MSTDYNLPAWFDNDETTDEERDAWFQQERCRRQALSQNTAYAANFKKEAERLNRMIEAHPSTVSLEEWR